MTLMLHRGNNLIRQSYKRCFLSSSYVHPRNYIRLHSQSSPTFSFSNANNPPKEISRIMEYKKQREEQNHINTEILKDELRQDGFQLPIKALAYFLAPGSLQPTFYAEFIRSGVFSLKHAIHFAMNFVKMGPTEKYPYGIDKIQNLAMLLPSVLFIFTGGNILVESIMSLFEYSSIYQLFTGDPSKQHDFASYSTLLYGTSMLLGMNVISKNVRRALQQEGDTSMRQMISNMQQLAGKEDPLFKALLYENMITFIVTSVPIFTAIVTYFLPWKIIEFLSTSIISCISIYMGIYMLRDNIPKLMGEQLIDTKTLASILKIMESNVLVKEISELKAVLFGYEKIRISAKISFNVEALNEKVMNSTETSIQKALMLNSVYSSTTRRANILENTVNLVLRQMIKEIQLQIDTIQSQIQHEFPSCEHIDLEFSYSETQEDYIKILYGGIHSPLLTKPQSQDEQAQEWKSWVISTAQSTIQKSLEEQHNSLEHQLKRVYEQPDLVENIKLSDNDQKNLSDLLSNVLSNDLLEEFYLFEEEWRPEMFSYFVIEDGLSPQ